MTKIAFRKVSTESDWLVIKTFLAHLFDYEKSIRDNRKPTTDIINGGVRFLKENVEKTKGAAFIASSDGRDIGVITGWVESGDGQDQGSNSFGYISDAFVLPEYRNQNVFAALLNEMTAYYKSIGIEKMSVSTLATNNDMQKVLEKTGFSKHKILYDKVIGS